MESKYFVDDYEHVNTEVEYVLENVLSEETLLNPCPESTELAALFNTILLNKCPCEKCNKLCTHGGSYQLDAESNELVIAEDNSSDLIYECSSLCSCKVERCHNRLVQYGPRKYLKIIFSKKFQSYGIITTRDIPMGAFICEYAGELLTKNEAVIRIRNNNRKRQMNYVLCLKEHLKCQHGTESNKGHITIVDPSKKGNIGRYLNHSCSPNCQIFSVRIDSPIPKIGK
ncbi:histone-lysine N-methyltransferase SETMAR [Musca vetustissima]|uniref:histone-lysine N-methyltransferase SETMAR n=1 Tax=Musca vetustissima TaxID=27455 RepID=UPI002AB68FC2|nr:histone-lysine N-methyltransferase SETMAR [Musca vetustissima]